MAVQTAEMPAKAHAADAELLAKHVDYFASVGDSRRSAEYAAELRHTVARIAHDEEAEAFVSILGLTNEVTKSTVTRVDAANFVAKVLHEVEQGVKASHYQRAHRNVDPELNDGDHVDLELMAAPWDPAADVVEHLGLTDPKHVSAARALFGKVA